MNLALSKVFFFAQQTCLRALLYENQKNIHYFQKTVLNNLNSNMIIIIHELQKLF
jgi:hypothetical protein